MYAVAFERNSAPRWCRCQSPQNCGDVRTCNSDSGKLRALESKRERGHKCCVRCVFCFFFARSDHMKSMFSSVF